MSSNEYITARLTADKIIEVSGFDRSKYKEASKCIELPKFENELTGILIDLMLGQNIFAKEPQSSFKDEEFVVTHEKLSREDPAHYDQLHCEAVEIDSKENAIYRIQMAIDECLDPFYDLKVALKKYKELTSSELPLWYKGLEPARVVQLMNDSIQKVESIVSKNYSEFNHLLEPLLVSARESNHYCRFISKSNLLNAGSLLENLFYLDVANMTQHGKENYMSTMHHAVTYLYNSLQEMRHEIACAVFIGDKSYFNFIESCANYKIEQDMGC